MRLKNISTTAGILYVLTFISIPTLFLYTSVRSPQYIAGPGPDTNAIMGVILEIIVALSGIGTAVTLYPVLKKQNEGMALGLVGSRVLEASTIFVGVAFILSIITLRKAGIGEEGVLAGQILTTLYDRIFMVGQGFLPAIDDLLLGYLLFKSRLVPRVLSVTGLIGAPLLITGDFSILFGFIEQRDALVFISAILVALFEFSLGLWLIFKGFNPSAPLLKSLDS